MTKLTYTAEELLADDAFEAPLWGGKVRCHGGYIDGAYVSPRGLHRRPAIEAWRARLREEGAERPNVCFRSFRRAWNRW